MKNNRFSYFIEIIAALAIFIILIRLFGTNPSVTTNTLKISTNNPISSGPTISSVSDITYNSATFRWNRSAGATQYRVKYTSDATWDTSVFVTDTFLNVKNLSSLVKYRFVVRRELPSTSSYTPELNFTTLQAPPERNTIFPQFNRILYISRSDTIYNNTSARNRLCSYLKKYGFNGVYLYDTQKYLPTQSNWINFSNFIKQLSDSGIVIRGITFGNSNYFLTTVKSYNNSQSDTSKKINHFHLENEYWNYGTNTDAVPYSTWINYLGSLKSSGVSNNFYMGYFKKLNVIDSIAAKDMLNNSKNIDEHVYVNGIPTYNFANNDSTTSSGGRLSIIARGGRQRNTPAQVEWIISLEDKAAGAKYTFSGPIVKANNFRTNPFDWIEQQSYNNIYGGMSSFQKQWIKPIGFVYYNLRWAYSSVPPLK
jgi:hypothetical protein